KDTTQGAKQKNMGDAFLQMGRLAKEFGDSEEAYQYFERARDLIKKQLETDSNDRWKMRLEEAYKNLAELSVERHRDMKKSLGFYEKALDLRKQTAAMPDAERWKENEKYKQSDWLVPFITRLNLSEAHTRVGLTHYFMYDSGPAEPHIRQSISIREKLVSDL